MLNELRELWKYRELLVIFVQRDLKVRYKNSALGFAWSLINPLVQVITIAVVLQNVMRFDIPSYYAYLFCATLPWLFFSTASLDTSVSLLYYHNLLRRVYFPRELIPLASVAANLIHFLAATGVFLTFMAVIPAFWWATGGSFDWALQPTTLLLPIPMLGLALLMSGIAMFVSVWTLDFEDTRFIIDSGLRVLYWLVPIVYFPEMVRHMSGATRGDLLHNLMMLNPLASYVSAFRKLTLPVTVIGKTPEGHPVLSDPMTSLDWSYLGIALLVSLAVAVMGHRYFWARQWRLAERA